MSKWQTIGSVVFLWLVLTLASVSAGWSQCTENGWVLYLETKQAPDVIHIQAHGPLRAWGRQNVDLGNGARIRLDTQGMFQPYGTVEYQLWLSRQQDEFEPYWEQVESVELVNHSLVCKWRSAWIEVPGQDVEYRIVFANSRWFDGPSHRMHVDVELAETIEEDAPFWISGRQEWK